jgi:hypothetical protein
MMATWVQDDGGRAAAGFKGQTRDCVARAIAIATEQEYMAVYNALADTAGQMRQTKLVRISSPRMGVARPVYERYLAGLGWTFVATMGIGTGCQVHLRADELPAGRIIARCSKHLVAVVDGVAHDTHDSTRGGTRCVYGYFRKAGE